jgi:hypothetical protein
MTQPLRPLEIGDKHAQAGRRIEAELGAQQRAVSVELGQRFRLVPLGQVCADHQRARTLSQWFRSHRGKRGTGGLAELSFVQQAFSERVERVEA